MEKPDTPILDKMLKVQKESRTIGDFLTFMEESGFVMCESRDMDWGERWEPTRENVEHMIALYFDIDLVQAEKERVALLDSIKTE